jgi:signal-transduction protein with cAMP-binding, CBS, and nucleotidyltransferase domain
MRCFCGRGKKVSTNDTNAEALAKMEQTGVDALVVVDDKLKFRGIVEREQLLSRMILALVSTSRVRSSQ